MKKILILYINSGGGHLQVARSLAQFLKNDFAVELYEPTSILGHSCNAIYNKIFCAGHLRLVFNWSSQLFVKLMQFYAYIGFKHCHKQLQTIWQTTAPDLVLSVAPLINSIARKSLNITYPQVPYLTLLTDMAECCPGAWVSSPQQIVICPSLTAYQQTT